MIKRTWWFSFSTLACNSGRDISEMLGFSLTNLGNGVVIPCIIKINTAACMTLHGF